MKIERVEEIEKRFIPFKVVIENREEALDLIMRANVSDSATEQHVPDASFPDISEKEFKNSVNNKLWDNVREELQKQGF